MVRHVQRVFAGRERHSVGLNEPGFEQLDLEREHALFVRKPGSRAALPNALEQAVARDRAQPSQNPTAEKADNREP